MIISRAFGSLAMAFLSAQFLNSSLLFAQTTQANTSVQIVDLSPKFLDFYETATREHADPDQRWNIWKEQYDFAAVPPISAGQKIARDQLDAAWAKYPEALPRVRRGAAALMPAPQARLGQVAELLGATGTIRIRLITFVGTFHHDAFSAGFKDGMTTIAIPLEDSDQDHAISMTHEFTHAVQMQMGLWSREDVASAIFAEGLAMRVTEHLNPGLQTSVYLTSSLEWLEECSAKLPEVLTDLQGHLSDSGADAVSKFTYGQRASGLRREVYCGGWFVVGSMLKSGRSFRDLGNLRQDVAETQVQRAIKQMLVSGKSAR